MKKTVQRRIITPDRQKLDTTISETLEWHLPVSSEKCKLLINLNSDDYVKVEDGEISVEEIHK